MCAAEDTPESREGKHCAESWTQAGRPAREDRASSTVGGGHGAVGTLADRRTARVRGGGRSGCFHYSGKKEASGEDGKGGVGV